MQISWEMNFSSQRMDEGTCELVDAKTISVFKQV